MLVEMLKEFICKNELAVANLLCHWHYSTCVCGTPHYGRKATVAKAIVSFTLKVRQNHSRRKAFYLLKQVKDILF